MTELVAVKKPKFLYSMPESENRVESFGLEGIFRITRFQPCEWKMDLRPCAVCVLRVQSLAFLQATDPILLLAAETGVLPEVA